ncbi:capping protein, Arp2/3 and myosin-I linker protein 2-like [Terrapene carolina triunguis]|uniref:capping protein, Arp2/3 and myosin-I linker protein 2-like n=1 Tax=Terrapene triunguis TaxID=2587831 RepID=UPI001156B5C3|nr:capping protein, Arp2/3 and myosin-I linker protein 2-like [Terrapene carolina triunguis]
MPPTGSGPSTPERRRHFEKSDGEIPSSFEQRVHVMLHRIGVTKVLSSEGKKKQVSLMVALAPSQCLALSTILLRCSSPRLSDVTFERRDQKSWFRWRHHGQLGGLPSPRLEISHTLHVHRRSFVLQEQSSPPEQQVRESWSSSLPRTGRVTPAPAPRRISNAGASRGSVDAIAADNCLKPKPRLKNVATRRAISVHEEQLREQGCTAALESVKIPLRLQRSPVLKRKPKPNSMVDVAGSSTASAPAALQDTLPQDEHRATAELQGEQPQAVEQPVENAQNSHTPKSSSSRPASSPPGTMS